LLYVGEYADPFLRKALEEKPSLEERRRIEQILEKVSLAKQPDDWPRTARALALLEHFGTPEAKHVLEQLAKGRAKAPITQGAEAALDRLEVQLRWPIADRVQAMRRGEPVLVARTILALTATRPAVRLCFLPTPGRWAARTGSIFCCRPPRPSVPLSP